MLIILLPVLLALYTPIDAHSWVEQLTVIAPNGTFVGEPGYARGNYERLAGRSIDQQMTNLIPPLGRAVVTQASPTDYLCKESQRTPTQLEGARLKASPGAAIALRYQENGHVTLPANQAGKPANRGTVYVYGTTDPKKDEKLLDVHKVWTADGKGGDGRGVLLAVQNFDDGRCYQINSGKISEDRQAKFPHTAIELMGADLWCQSDIKLPANVPVGKPYTLYWVWDWPTLPGADPTYPKGKAEIYTTCMDVDVVAKSNSKLAIKDGFVNGQDLNKAAIPGVFNTLGKAQSLPPPTTFLTSIAPAAEASATGVERQTLTVTDWVTSTSTIFMERSQPTSMG
ncbi:uncharacterized protein N7515_006422 [Penicillium bovifimosum]|uniref:DUF7492 domain-containing protein n=1 Tax=Penicillium bovifimosum TaxID=126998 RepID=A0A9W9KZQ8_9EURO|nr:uncharacterized protein N7515_006422 [Penicillium bovifimosum]KAJ5130383.1 hypothetical protein N7515_006422 [Penicillium bovifimosum]